MLKTEKGTKKPSVVTQQKYSLLETVLLYAGFVEMIFQWHYVSRTAGRADRIGTQLSRQRERKLSARRPSATTRERLFLLVDDS